MVQRKFARRVELLRTENFTFVDVVSRCWNTIRLASPPALAWLVVLWPFIGVGALPYPTYLLHTSTGETVGIISPKHMCNALRAQYYISPQRVIIISIRAYVKEAQIDIRALHIGNCKQRHCSILKLLSLQATRLQVRHALHPPLILTL